MISPSRQPNAAVRRSSNAIELAFVDDYFGAFYPVMAFIAFWWQKLREQLRLSASGNITTTKLPVGRLQWVLFCG
jgi:hypothetical protein